MTGFGKATILNAILLFIALSFIIEWKNDFMRSYKSVSVLLYSLVVNVHDHMR